MIRRINTIFIAFKNKSYKLKGSIKIKTGCLQVLDCPNSAVQLELNVEKDTYRVRVYGANLASVVGDEGDDFYRIEVWKASFGKWRILKKYKL